MTVGAGFSANGHALAGPWTVNPPLFFLIYPRGFVDPVELSVTVTGDDIPGPTGQVYAGLVNGVAYNVLPLHELHR